MKVDRQLKAVVSEMYDPMLIGNTSVEVDLATYSRSVKASKSHSLFPSADRRLPFHISGQIAHVLIRDLLVRYGWRVLSHDLGRGSSPLVLEDPVKFTEKTIGIRLNEKVRKLIRSPNIGIPGLSLRCDMLVARRGMFAMIEIKSSRTDTEVFRLTLPQYLYYNNAHSVGIPIKLILVKFLDCLHISITRYFGELTQKDLFKVTLYMGGSKLQVLRLTLNNPYSNLTKIARMIPRMPKEWVKGHLEDLESAGLIAKEKNKWYCTEKGRIFLKNRDISQKIQ